MGLQLAAMHRQGTSDRFGWEINNTIGSTTQINSWMSNWADFFAEQRIGYQLNLAKRRGGEFSRIAQRLRRRIAVALWRRYAPG